MSVYKKKMASGKLYNGQFSDDDVSQQKFKFLSIFEKKLLNKMIFTNTFCLLLFCKIIYILL